MTSREEQNALIDLQKLLASDLSKAGPDDLLQGVRDAELTFEKAQDWCGQLVKALREHHEMSWPALERLTGVPRPTLIRRMQEFEEGKLRGRSRKRSTASSTEADSSSTSESPST